MPKLFCVSDIHSFYTPMKKALDEAGFDPNNKEHWLIVCGDAFDRGNESLKVYDFLMGLERKILVKGNHDILLRDMLERGHFEGHDIHNGTDKTFWQIANREALDSSVDLSKYVYGVMDKFWKQQVNYFETQNYIFVHSWIPCKLKTKPHPADKWIDLTTAVWNPNWRDCDDFEWEEAMWGNPFWKSKDGLNKTKKTIVFGHWHCSLGHSIDSDGEITEFGANACWDIYWNKDQQIIGIDRCTAHTGEVNVLVLEDDFIESQS